MQPGDTVSLIVRGKNPLEPQKFVDVGSLLMELQKVPPPSDGSYHVFLAPPNFPQPVGGQKFDVTYVGAPPREQQQTKDPRNPHPPLFVAPLDYSVPQGYGRVQIPTRNVKFALNGGLNSLPFQPAVQQPVQQQTLQFQPPQPAQPFRQAQPQFQPQPQQVQQQIQQAQQFKQQQQQPQPVQFLSPQPAQFLPPQPQFQPILPPPARFQPVQPQFQPVQPQFQPNEIQRPQFKQTPPAPASFEQSLSDVRIQTGFVPVQALEETQTVPPPPPPPVAPKEPLVLAVESPEFLEIIKPVPPPPAVDVIKTVPEAPLQPAIKTEEKVVVPVEKTEVKLTTPVAAAVTLAPLPEDVSTPAPTPAFEQTIPAATPIPAPVISEVSQPETTRPIKKRPSIRIPLEGGSPQWPDFASVRQRQQLQRQQNNRKKTTASLSSTNTFDEAISQDESEVPVEPSFGQKIRKVKTNALVSPPISTAEPKVTVELPQPQSLQQPQSFEIDPPVVEGDEAFQTLESQNAASGNQRGRIRFNRPSDSGSANAIQSEGTTAPPAPVRQTISTLVGGRGRLRISTLPTTTLAPTPAPTPEPTAAPLPEPIPGEEPAKEDQVIRGDNPIEPEEETIGAAQDEEVLVEEETEEQETIPDDKSAEPAEKPWSPYEAIQRQRETTVEPEAASQVISNSGQPIRIRGKTTFSSSRIPIAPVLADVSNRQIVLRPAASIRRPSAQTVRISKPALEVPQEQNIRLQDDLIPPAAPGFGIRGGVESKPVLVSDPPPAQFLLPVGRRVPEVRPGFQTIRIGRPTTTETPLEVVVDDDVIVEEDPVDVGPLDETNEFVTDDPNLAIEEGLDEEEEVEEDEILTDDVEGEGEGEEFEEVVDQVDVTTGIPVAGSVDATTDSAVVEIVEEQEGDAAGQEVVDETTKLLKTDESVSTTTAPTVTVIESQPSSEEEGVVELTAGNQVDDQSKQSSPDERQVLGVSTATEVSLMYELCYRGRCVRVHE